MKITTKAEFFKLWEAGCLGNRTRLWRDPEKAWQDALRLKLKNLGLREIRERKGGAGAWARPELPDYWSVIEEWKRLGRKFIIDDGVPDENRVLQGEICRTYFGLEGYLDTRSELNMRQAMAAGHMRHCTPAVTMALLEKFMDPSSRDDLDALLDLYPDAAIEFSTFNKNVGVFPHRNTIFWETRDY